MRSLKRTSLALCLASSLTGCVAADLPASASAPAQQRPNIIVILTDDQGWADVGFNGSKEIPTPNIDRIANEGVRFERGYVTFPVSGPSRAGLMTGRYQSRFGFDLNPTDNPLDTRGGLPLSEDLMPAVLKRAGYTSGLYGKWHLGYTSEYHPNARGFDDFFGFLDGGHNYFLEQLKNIPREKIVNGGQNYNTWLEHNDRYVPTKGYLTDFLSDRAVDFATANKDKPFFLFLSYNAPHVPMQATKKYLDRFKHIADPRRRTYAAMVSAVDDGVGKLLDRLDQLKIADNTIVFFLSDNGGPQELAKNGSINLPLQGGKGDLNEGGIRVPFAMRWPGKIPTGITYPHPVSSLDIMATAVGVNGIDMSGRNPLDGKNLVPYLQDRTLASRPHQDLFWRYVHESDGSNVKTASMSGEMKLLRVPGATSLYNLAADQGETNNLLKQEPVVAQTLQSKFEQWNSQMKPISIRIFNAWPLPGSDQPAPKDKRKAGAGAAARVAD